MQGTPCATGMVGPGQHSTCSAFACAISHSSVIRRLLSEMFTNANLQPLLISLAWQKPQPWVLDESQAQDCFRVCMLHACSWLLWLLTCDLAASPSHCLMQLWKPEAFPPAYCGFLLCRTKHLITYCLCCCCWCSFRLFQSASTCPVPV